MADSILRLRVDSQEYDNKLKRAAEGLQRYADGCRKAGGTLTQLDDGVEEFVKGLGNMETVSKSAKGSIAEMTKAFTELSVQYNKLTDEEKQAPFGKALSESLNTLKGRIQSGNAELKNIGDSLNNTGGVLDQLKSKFTINVDAITLFNKGLEAAKVALDVAKDAFFASETNVDDWGRTVAAAEGVYDSFLQSLNSGDFSGFIGHIDEIIKKAHDAYNALDELNTRMTIINPERTRLQARATELKAIIRRQGKDSTAGQAAQTELKQLEGMLTQAFKTESQLNMNAFKAQVDKKLQDAGIKLSQKDYNFLMRTFSSDASYMAMKRGAKGSTGRNYENGGAYDEGSTSAYGTRNINQRLLDLFTDEWRKEYSPLLNAAFSARGGAASTMLSDARYLKEGGGGGGRSGGGSSTAAPTYDVGSMAEAQAEVQKLSKLWNEAGADVRNQYLQPLIEAEQKVKDMQNAMNLQKEQAQGKLQGGWIMKTNLGKDTFADSIVKPIDEIAEYYKKNPIVIHVETAVNDVNAVAESAKAAAKAVSSIGNAFSQIEDPAAKVAGLVAHAIATVAAAYAQALETDWSSKTSIWTFIAAAAASTASMVSTIASIHSATGYAQGGMIKGNSYSGDNIGGLVDGSQLVGLNAGEVVLNAAGQQNLAANLQGAGSLRGLNLRTKVKGTELLVWLDNSLAQSGRGELVTWGQ